MKIATIEILIENSLTDTPSFRFINKKNAEKNKIAKFNVTNIGIKLFFFFEMSEYKNAINKMN